MQRSYHQKTIYVKPDDLARFEEASNLGESLSSIIAESLREYIGRHYIKTLTEKKEKGGCESNQ